MVWILETFVTEIIHTFVNNNINCYLCCSYWKVLLTGMLYGFVLLKVNIVRVSVVFGIRNENVIDIVLVFGICLKKYEALI